MLHGDDAFKRMMRLRDALRQMLETESRRPARTRLWQPPLDMIATDDAYVLRFDLPGAAREDIEATVEDSVLRVHGSTRRVPGLEDAREVRTERITGAFGRSVRLPADADTADVTAKLENGVLTVRLGRRRRKSSHIEIEIA